MKDNTPQAVQAAHELLRWLIPQLDKFPRSRRFTLQNYAVKHCCKYT